MKRWRYRLLSGRAGAGLELRILMRQTARAFGVAAPKRAGRSAAELLESYAQFTAETAGRVIQEGEDLRLLQRKLFHMACRLGNLLRRWLGAEEEKDCFALLLLLYRNLGITISEEGPWEFCVSKCYFSDFYTAKICALISAIDAGIFAGIYQGGTLVFRARITEGKDRCRAELRSGGRDSRKRKTRK